MSMIDSILIPIDNCCNNNPPNLPEKQVLLKDNFLSEFEKVDEKEAARLNLGVRGKDEVYTKEEVERIITNIVTQAILSHNDDKNSHKIKEAINTIYGLIIKKDGSISFENPQSGVDPVNSNHLTTKNYVDTKYSSLITKTENKIQELVRDFLARYPKANNIALKDETVRFKKLQCLLKTYIKSDGSVPFSKPQRGKNPIEDDHLATKSYVDTKVKLASQIDNILNEVSEHHYTKDETYTKNDVYTKNETVEEIKRIFNLLNFVTDSNISVNFDKDSSTITLGFNKSNEEGNKILFKQDGIYLNVEHQFDNGILKLLVNGSVVSEHNIVLGSMLNSSRYNPEDETIIIEFLKKQGETQVVKIPVSDLIKEWEVDNNGHSINLNIVRNINGKDKLSADIKISEEANNQVKLRSDGIYVPEQPTGNLPTTTDNITHNDENLKTYLENLGSNSLDWIIYE